MILTTLQTSVFRSTSGEREMVDKIENYILTHIIPQETKISELLVIRNIVHKNISQILPPV